MVVKTAGSNNNNNEMEALVDKDLADDQQQLDDGPSSRGATSLSATGPKVGGGSVIVAMPREHKGRLLCSARVAVTLIAVALTLAICSVWLCLDIRAMLIREADQVQKIKQLVEYIYTGYSKGVLDQGGASKSLEDYLKNLELNYDGTIDSFHPDWSDYDYNAESHPGDMFGPLPEPQHLETSWSQCDLMPDSWKFDCHPEQGATQETCLARGCCWQTPDLVEGSIGVPSCFYPASYPGYSSVNLTKTETGYLSFLNRTTKSYYPEDVVLLKMEVFFETNWRLHIKISDAQHQRYEVPFLDVPPPVTSSAENPYYNVSFLPDGGFKVLRKATGETIFDASVGAFLFCNQFIQISALLPSVFLYGIGEQRDSFLHSFNWKRLVLFAADQVPRENTNLYGAHPFYLMMENSGKSHGVFLLNSNAMEVILQPTPAITYRTIGGILDFYFFLGPEPADVVRQYTDVIGRPFLPPYWSLGFHLCRFNYGSVEGTRAVWKRNRDAGIPFDVQWNDIDYMSKKRDFTVDQQTFGDLKNFVEEVHDVGMHYVPMIDCGIAVSERPGDYPPYDEGSELDIFVKDSSGKDFVGQVWPGQTVWPDFIHPNATRYWSNQIQGFHQLVPFDGIWIDMNEPANFLSGTKDGCPETQWDDPPYVPAVVGGQLSHRTLCMSAMQTSYRHYDVHNLYGLSEMIATNAALSSLGNKRPFIITRSSYPGLGAFGGHWTGDVTSTWHDMARSVSEILNFNLFGIPMVGADICGFNGNTTVKLCQRWMELGAFYPFARNHNTDDGIDQDPAALGPDVVAASVKALYVRYQLLPYLYTLFYKAHVEGVTVARPLFFEFPSDRHTYNVDTQFLWGSGLMILPVLQEDVTVIYPYFPMGTWYLLPSRDTVISSGSNFRVTCPLDTICLALRGGSILPVQGVNRTTTASRFQMFELWVALDDVGHARGDLYWDDGNTNETVARGDFNYLTFQVEQNKLSSQVARYAYHGENPMTLGGLTVYGVQSGANKVTVNGKDWPLFKFDDGTKILTVNQLQVRMANPLVISWA